MPDLTVTDQLISKLARELARNLYPPATIREQFKLTLEEYDEILETPFFRTRLEEEVALWNDPSNAKQRISAKSATMLEEALPDIFVQIADPTVPLAAKVAALQMAGRWAGVENNASVKQGEESDRRVKITINIGANKIAFEKEIVPAKVIEGEAVEVAA